MANRPAIRGIWRDDLATRAVYAEAAGIQRILPKAIAVPADAADVVELVKWAASTRTPLTARGSGSSMGGGAIGSGVVVDFSRLDAIGTVDQSARAITVGPGVVCADLMKHAARAGLRLPVDPSSAAFCTVGGMASTNAAGGRTLRYGQMNTWVRGLECVFTDGTRAWVRRGEPAPDTPALGRFRRLAPRLRDEERNSPSRHAGVRKESSGYGLSTWASSDELVELLAGSEGTLALFTALDIQLAPIPAYSGTIVAVFSTLDDAVGAASIAAELNASACELLDRTFLEVARTGGRTDVPDAEAVLIVEIEEGDPGFRDQLMGALTAAFESAGATIQSSVDPHRSTELWGLRHAASPIIASMSAVLKSMQIIEDGAVPPARLADYIRGVRGIFEASGFRGVIFGHAGDGHVHANVLVDVREPDWRARVERVFSEGVALIQRLGGTLTGEHGDGRLRADAMARVWAPASLARFRAVKDAFDPEGILNPGVKFVAPAAPVLGGVIKYDPDIEPLPAASRRVLDRVQSERAWNRWRLELLDEELER
jgi:FAD/FMN-containing dehydrogenase